MVQREILKIRKKMLSWRIKHYFLHFPDPPLLFSFLPKGMVQREILKIRKEI